jgi:enoyl-CoA hydratase/carnithine racemase
MRIRIKKSAPSGTIVLDVPKTHNALSREMVADFREALDDFHREKSVRCVILVSSGATFCSGVDLKQWNEVTQSESPLDAWQEVSNELQELIEAMLRFPKPIIAAIDGPVFGGGLGLVLGADLVVATPKATFSSRASRIGLVSGLVAPLLSFRLGASVASRILLGLDPVTADQAYQWGLVQYLVESEQVWAKSHQLATQIAESSTESIQMTKRLLNEMIGEPIWSHLISGAAVMATVCSTESASEGMRSFVDKRPTKFP